MFKAQRFYKSLWNSFESTSWLVIKSVIYLFCFREKEEGVRGGHVGVQKAFILFAMQQGTENKDAIRRSESIIIPQ